jgi:hypothetical protein
MAPEEPAAPEEEAPSSGEDAWEER